MPPPATAQRALLVQHPEVVELPVLALAPEDVEPAVREASGTVQEAGLRRGPTVDQRRQLLLAAARVQPLPLQEAPAPGALGPGEPGEVSLANLGAQERVPEQILAGDLVEPTVHLQHEPQDARLQEAEDVQRQVVRQPANDRTTIARGRATRADSPTLRRWPPGRHRVLQPSRRTIQTRPPRRAVASLPRVNSFRLSLHVAAFTRPQTRSSSA